MFAKSDIQAKLDEKIADAIAQLDHHQTSSDEYGAVLEHLAKLQKLKIEETQNELRIHENNMKVTETDMRIMESEHKLRADSRLKLPSTDTMLVVGANIFGILWLTRYERERAVTSKALGFVMKPR